MTTPSRELKRRARCVLEGKYFFASNAACSLMLYSFTAAIILQYTGLGTSEKPVGIAFYYILWLITALLGSLFEILRPQENSLPWPQATPDSTGILRE